MPKMQLNPRFYISLQIIVIGLLQCISQYSSAQDCDCKNGEKITVCYYSTNEFCPPDTECRYTLDGDFMVNSLNAKLQNTNLFGPEGISKCPIVLEQVRDVNTVAYLEQKECNIMFIGVFTDFDFQNGSFIPTSIPQSDLFTIKEWSTKCPANLTIVSQIEAEPWGYEFEDLNENPNYPDPDFTDYSIFNGTFGEISSFSQGGTFQGIFTAYPTTGYSVLARDRNDEPTIVLDSITNDIILGDIGMLCNGPGPLSVSPNILNDSDILACNLFDLGCKIATNSTTDFINICEGESYITSGGQFLEIEGIYVDSFINMEGCDSLIYTLLDINSLYDTVYTQRICSNDSYTIQVGSNLYGVTNTFGTELLESSEGCDSTVHIELYYFQTDTTYLVESICNNDTFFVGNIPNTETTIDVFLFQNKDLCDSFVYLDLIVHDTYDLQTQVDLCPGEVYYPSPDNIIFEDSIYIEFLLSANGCDSIQTITITTFENYEYYEYYEGCEGDGFSMNIGMRNYNETNPVGTEYLHSSAGCDSIIQVEFHYYQNDTTYLNESICEGDTFQVGNFLFSETNFSIVPLQNTNFCDSTIYLNLVVNKVYQTQTNVDLCPGENYITSDGTILTGTSNYLEFHYSEFGCDSMNTIITTSQENYEIEESYLGCQGDGFSTNIGGTVYSESNPIGSEFLQSSKGCDSIVNVSYIYQPLDTTYLFVQLCPYEYFEVGGEEYSGNLYETITLPSSKNCDSIVILDLETFESEEVVLESNYDVDLNSFFSFDLPEIETSSYIWNSDGDLSCDTCSNPILSLDNLPTMIELEYIDTFNCIYASRAEITYRCTPFFPNVIYINSTTPENRQFNVKALCPFENYSLTVFDRWGSSVFTSRDQGKYWDGRKNGKFVEQGVYMYLMSYYIKGQEQQKIGSLTLLR